MAYQHIFFDLDHTLWDYDRNARETLEYLFEEAALVKSYPFVALTDFIQAYHEANRLMWDGYNKGLLSKEQLREQRFWLVLNKFGIEDPHLVHFFEEGFLALCPTKPHTLPFTHETLEYLSLKYSLHIITNGFNVTQWQKMKSAGIAQFFDVVVTSETQTSRKPDPSVFHFAMQQAGAAPENSLMVGDNPETDIAGALAVGMHTVLFDPESKFADRPSTYSISCLSELQVIV